MGFGIYMIGILGKLYLCGFKAVVATEWLITHHCLLSVLDGLDFMFGEKHRNRGAIKCLDTLIGLGF